MALKAYMTEAEFQGAQAALGHEAVKAVGVEFAKGEDGNYHPVIEPRDGFALENVKGLQTAIESEREARRKAEAAVKGLGDVKPEDLPTLLDKAKKYDGLAGEQGKLKQQFDEWKAEHAKQLEAQHVEAVRGVEQQRDSYRRQLEHQLITSQATQILADPKVKGNPALLLPIIANLTDTVEEDVDGQKVLRVRVLNPAKPGRERIGKTGGAMTLDELVGELRQDARYASAFEGSGASGAGSAGGSGSADYSGFPAKRGAFSVEQKAKFIHEHGSAAYFKLPD